MTLNLNTFFTFVIFAKVIRAENYQTVCLSSRFESLWWVENMILFPIFVECHSKQLKCHLFLQVRTDVYLYYIMCTNKFYI